MKILHLISGGDTGGAKTHVLSLIKELSKTNNIKIICFIEDEFYKDGIEMGIDIEVYKQKKRYDLSIIKRLIKEIKNEDYDIIHSHGARANFISLFLKKFIKKPFITTIHSDYKLDFKDDFYKKIVYTFLNTFSLRNFDYFIAVSNNFKKMLIDRGFSEKRIFTIYNGIDLNDDIKIQSKEEFLRKHNIFTDNEYLVGIVARLDLVKNHEVFINAAKKVIHKRKDVIFLIAGDGSEKKRLISMINNFGISEKVIFLGRVDDPDSFFNAIDINVLTSKSESFPYVILEGARQKKVIISTDVGGIKDLVKNGVNGYLFEVGDSEKLSHYIQDLLENDNKINEMGEKLYIDVKNKFSLENMAYEHNKIYTYVKKNKHEK